jgi:hypothetical protein
MALTDTMAHLTHLLTSISKDLPKVTRGNKTAAQRIRVSTLKLERVGKIFRKESVAALRGGKLKKRKKKKR